jgi:hypothetical protein
MVYIGIATQSTTMLVDSNHGPMLPDIYVRASRIAGHPWSGLTAAGCMLGLC